MRFAGVQVLNAFTQDHISAFLGLFFKQSQCSLSINCWSLELAFTSYTTVISKALLEPPVCCFLKTYRLPAYWKAGKKLSNA